MRAKPSLARVRVGITQAAIPALDVIPALAALTLVLAPVSHAVAQDAIGMDGRANDASNLVGSGGRNAETPRSFYNSANLYITGNVSRGAYFRGVSPIRDSNSLFLALPSADMGDFQRDAINLDYVLHNPAPWQSTPYFNPYRTVTGVGAIQAGLNLPGTNVPGTTYIVPQPYAAGLPDATPFNVATGTRSSTTVMPNSSIYTPDNSDLLRSADSYDRLRMTSEERALQQSPVFGRAPTSGVSGLPARSANQALADPYALDLVTTQRLAVEPIQRQSRTAATLDRGTRDAAFSDSRDLRTPGTLAPKLIGDPSADPAQRDPLYNPLAPPTSPGAANDGRPMTAEPIAHAPITTEPIVPVSVTDQVQAMTQLDSGMVLPMGTPFADGQTPDDPAADVDATATSTLLELADAVTFLQDIQENPNYRDQLSATPSLREQYNRAMTTVRRSSDSPLQSLAGRDGSRVSELMREAEAKTRAGEYYPASSLYGLAASLDEHNPLIRLGYAHALAAAGEYMTAVLNLETAIAAYPAFGFLQLDLNDFVRDPKDLDLRRADLEQQLERRENYRLRFLLGYLEYFSGFQKFGLPNLQKAAAAAPADSVIARLPEMLEAPHKFFDDADAAAPTGNTP